LRFCQAVAAEKVAGLLTTLKRLAKQFILLLRGLQLELGDQLHNAVLQMFSPALPPRHERR
jgi:hypothetical protein